MVLPEKHFCLQAVALPVSAEQPSESIDRAGHHSTGRDDALAAFARGLENTLSELLDLPDEMAIDPRWVKALSTLKSYALRPAKRVRPALLVTGWAMASNVPVELAPEGVRQFAAALELLHTFMLIHDDVADRALSRRGGPALQQLVGDDLAVIMGDHLYSRAIEVMLSCGASGAGRAARYMMSICRHTAAGQYLDLDLGSAALGEVTLFQTLKIAHLKTAKYGFIAPLVAGAMLGGGDDELLASLERAGRYAGMAYQLRDDVLGLFGDDAVAGKQGGADFFEGKRTFPVIAAWTRADFAGREQLEAMWHADVRTADQLGQARAHLEACGGRAATERVIERTTRSARKALEALPNTQGAREVLDRLFARMVRRTS